MDSIICARGESARTIVPVVRALTTVGNVILVDDGENDGLEHATLAGALIVSTPYPAGKSSAMLYGLEFVTSDRVIFCDADITGFTAGHASQLAEPHDGMITGFRDNYGSRYLGIVPSVSGERSLPADVARHALTGCTDSYEAETAINAEIGNRGLPVSTFIMHGVRNPSKQPVTRSFQILSAALAHLIGLLGYVFSWLTSHLDSDIRQWGYK